LGPISLLPILTGMSSFIKTAVFEVLRLPGINVILRACRPLLAHFDVRTVDRLPVRGPVLLGLPQETPFVMESDGRDSVASAAYWVGLERYEGCTLKVFAHLCRQSREIVDVGANTGLFSLLAAAVHPDARIHAFEPFPHAARRMEANLQVNGFANVHLVRTALSREPGIQPLYFDDALRLTQGATLRNGGGMTHKVDVPVLRLDDYLQRLAAKLDLLKIDVEGAEPDVLAGAEECIAECHPEIITELLVKDCFPKLRDFVRRHGYIAFRLAAEGLYPDPDLTDDGPPAMNRLLVHPRRMERIAGLPLLR
jgi:FkbM family methyltransferase